MPVEYLVQKRQFHLRNQFLSYVIHVYEDGSLGNLHIGAPLSAGRSYEHLKRRGFLKDGGFSDEAVRFEYPAFGMYDHRVSAVAVFQEDGSRGIAPVYRDHRIFPGKKELHGLPSSYVEKASEAETLEIDLTDSISGLNITLSYTLWADAPLLIRSANIGNGGGRKLDLRNAMSLSVDLADSDWTMIHLSGTWARERHVKERRLEQGLQAVSSIRGGSSHQHNPFIALRRENTGEDRGEVFGFSLVYSGNFLAEIDVDAWNAARVRMGINPESFSWRLEPGQSFQTPEAVMVYSNAGLGAMSEAFHNFFGRRLARGPWRDRDRPILVNNWEATYFNFDEKKLLALADRARQAGIELFVLDDGWFGLRNDDSSSLGDWVVNPQKLPRGIAGLANAVEERGLRFGLWIEPEMISPDSDLFRAHPDWAIGYPGRERTIARKQYVLDMSRPEIIEHLYRVFSDILRSAKISYIKWDRNRSIGESFSLALAPDRQGEFYHRYILGLYDLLGRLTREFPDVLFESCAGGGGRFDPGMLAYAPQAWASDDTDAVERIKIQWGGSLVYPVSSTGAHVSAVPNHQLARTTPLATRGAVAFFGAFGYELDLTALNAEEMRELADQVAFYKQYRTLFQFGRFVRLKSPFITGSGASAARAATANDAAWMTLSADGNRAIVAYYRILRRPIAGHFTLKLRELDPASAYRVRPWPVRDEPPSAENAGVRGGDELMNVGLLLGGESFSWSHEFGDFHAQLYILDRVMP